jgi:hypothetical protein
MAVLVVLSVMASVVSSAVTTAVTLRLHVWTVQHRHHVLTPEERFLQHKTFTWSHPEKWTQ